MIQTLDKIYILPEKDSVLIVSPVFHLERFIYAPDRKRKIETQSYVRVHLSEFY